MHWKSLMRHMNVMNAALLAILILFAANKVPSFFNTQAKYTLPSPSKSAEMEEKTVETPPLSPSEYTAIADQNIFHPDRMIPAFKADAPPLPKPEFILYGTLVSSDISLAYMEDLKAGASPAKGRRQKAVKKGESISGFTINAIETEKVVLTRGEETLEVRVTDKPRSRGNGSAQAQQVSPVQPASRLVQPSPSVASPQTRANEARKRREAVRNTPGNVKN